MSYLKYLATVVIVLLLLGLGPQGTAPLHKAYGVTRTISLVGHYLTGWNSTPANPIITITQGDTVIVTTSSGDPPSIPHRFFVDVNGGGMTPDCSVDKCASMIPPTATDTLTGFSQGTYTYYCQYHSVMRGTFTVQAPSAVPDFGISSDRSSLSIVVGSFGSATITLTSQNGFTGNVNLTGTVSPSGPTLSFNPVTVSLTSVSSATSTLNVATSSGLYSSSPTGSYTVTVTGSASLSLSHSVILSVTVTSSSSSSAAPIPLTVLAIVVVAIIAVAGVVAFAVLRRKPGK